MKNLRKSRVYNTIQSLFYLALLVALALFIIKDQGARNTIGAFGLALLWIIITFGSLLIVARWWRHQQAPTIHPFLNATGDRENKEKYDALALNFSELLQLEMQRIREVLTIPESISAYKLALKQGVVPGPISISPRGAGPGSTRVEDELVETLKGIGAFSIGSVSLPLGGLLYLIVQAFQGGGISGRLQKFGSIWMIVASFEDRTYELRSDELPEKEQNEDSIARALARQLAYMMSSDLADFSPSRWQSFREVVDGLGDYKRYWQSGAQNFIALDAARQHFEKAIVEDSEYAWAYYNLGQLYEDTGNSNSAFEMYKLATQKEPNMREAHFKLGQAYFAFGQNYLELKQISIAKDYILNAIRAGERVVAKSTKHPFPLARAELGHWLGRYSDSLISENLENFGIARDYCNQALKQLKAANKEYAYLIRQERHRMNYSEKRLASLRKYAIISLKELSRTYQILMNILELEATSQGKGNQQKIEIIRRKWESALLERLKLDKEDSAALGELGRFHLERKIYPKAREYLEKAHAINPEDNTIILILAATYLNPAYDDLTNMINEYRKDMAGWQKNWPEQRINTTQTQLAKAEICYRSVFRIIRDLGENDQSILTESLKGLADTYRAQAWIQYVQSKPIQDWIFWLELAKRFLGKAIVLNPFDAENYDNLAAIYQLESEYYSEEQKNSLPDKGEVINQEIDVSIAPENIKTSIETINMMEEVYATLRDCILQFQESKDTAQIVMRLAISSPEERAGITLAIKSFEDPVSQEIVRQLLTDGDLNWPLVAKAKVTPITRSYLWAAAWMFLRFDKENSKNVIRYLEKALEIAGFFEADLVNYDLANIYRSLKKWNKAREHINKIEEADPYYWQSWIGLADALFSENKLDEAESAYLQAIYAAGTNIYHLAQSWASYADVLRSKKRYDDAIKFCQNAINLVPAYPYPYRVLALIYYNLYDYDRSMEYWKRAAELAGDLDQPLPHQGLGDAYNAKAASSTNSDVANAWRKQAVHEYRRAIQLLGPEEIDDKVNTQTILGDVLADLKQYSEAEIAYLGALELSKRTPEDYSLHMKLANVYVKRGIYADARSEYQKGIQLLDKQIKEANEKGDKEEVLQLTGRLAEACNQLAYDLHAERGINLEEGLELVNRALTELEQSGLDERAKRNQRGNYLDTRGWLYYRQGNYDTAKGDLEEALSLTMGTVYEHGHLALLYEYLAESKQDEAERKRLQMMSKEQWSFAFALDHEGIWDKYKPPSSIEVGGRPGL